MIMSRVQVVAGSCFRSLCGQLGELADPFDQQFRHDYTGQYFLGEYAISDFWLMRLDGKIFLSISGEIRVAQRSTVNKGLAKARHDCTRTSFVHGRWARKNRDDLTPLHRMRERRPIAGQSTVRHCSSSSNAHLATGLQRLEITIGCGDTRICYSMNPS